MRWPRRTLKPKDGEIHPENLWENGEILWKYHGKILKTPRNTWENAWNIWNTIEYMENTMENSKDLGTWED